MEGSSDLLLVWLVEVALWLVAGFVDVLLVDFLTSSVLWE